MSSCHLTAAVLFRDAAPPSHGQNLPYSNWCSLHAHTYRALGSQDRSKSLWWWLGTQQTFCPWKDKRNDSCDRGREASRAITSNYKYKTLWKREKKGIHTRISKNQLLQAKPVFMWLLLLIPGDSGTSTALYRGNKSRNQRLLCQASFCSGRPPNSRGFCLCMNYLSNSSEFLQQKSLQSELQTKLSSALVRAVIQREANANKY